MNYRSSRQAITRVVLLAAVAILVGIGAVRVAGETVPIMLGEWGKWGHGTGEFDNIGEIAVDGSGYVYVADRFNNRIQKFKADGTYVSQWGKWGHGNGEFVFPTGLAIDTSGSVDYVYVADQFNHRIQKFKTDGTYVAQWGSQGTGVGEFDSPQAVAVDKNGVVYVADSGNDRIQWLATNGIWHAAGSSGSSAGQFSVPVGIAADHLGNVFVADFFNHRLQKRDTNGVWHIIGTYGSGAGQFIHPHGLAVDASGNVYVTDQNNHRVQKLTGSGSSLIAWGHDGDASGQFSSPTGIAVDPSSGSIYVADLGNSRIEKFGTNPVTIQFLDQLKEYKDNGIDRVYRRGANHSFRVELTVPSGYGSPKLEITDPGKSAGQTNATYSVKTLANNVVRFKVTIPGTNPVGAYQIGATLSHSGSQVKVPAFPIYAIFEVPSSFSASAEDAYLYDEAGHRDEQSYTFSSRNGSYVGPKPLPSDPKKSTSWRPFWPEKVYVLNPFDRNLFTSTIEAIDGETKQAAVAQNLMYAVSRIIWYTSPNGYYDVSKMLANVDVSGGIGAAYGPQGMETQYVMGQCLDYANALAALLRTVGIPARVATLIDAWNFSYHQWTEAYLESPPSGTDKWYVFDAMDYTPKPHTVQMDLWSGPTGSDPRATFMYGDPFEVIVGDTNWKVGGKVEIKKTGTGYDSTGSPFSLYGLRRYGTGANDALFERCEGGNYSSTGCPDVDPPDTDLLDITMDREMYRVGDTIVATMRVVNPEASESRALLGFRVLSSDAADDGRDAFGDPHLEVEGSGLFGETLLAEEDEVTIPGGGYVERSYEYFIEDAALPNTQLAVEVRVERELGVDTRSMTLDVRPAFDLELSVNPDAPEMGSEFEATLTIVNQSSFSVGDIRVAVESSGLLRSERDPTGELDVLEPGQARSFSWLFSPAAPSIPSLQHLVFTVETENGGSQTERLEVEFLTVPMPVIRSISPGEVVRPGQAVVVSYEIENIGSQPILGASASLLLPDELSLAAQPSTIQLGDLGGGEQVLVNWTLIPETADVHSFDIVLSDSAGTVLAEQWDLVDATDSPSEVLEWLDDFAGPELGPQWFWIGEDPSMWNLMERPGFLRIWTQPSGFFFEENRTRNLLALEAPSGSFGIETHVLFSPAENFQKAGLVVYGDDDHALVLSLAYCDVPETCVRRGVYFDKEWAGELAEENHAFAVDSTTEIYLRIERRGSECMAFVSGGGDDWEPIGSHYFPFPDPLSIGIVADDSNMGAQELPADFDWFLLQDSP